MLNHVTIQGRLTATPELTYTQSGVPCTRFTIANNTGVQSQATGEEIVYFIDVTAWKKQAEFACNYLEKGRLVIVEGELTTRNYTDKNGNNRKAVEVNASRLHFSDSKPKSESGGYNRPAAKAPVDDFAPGYESRASSVNQQQNSGTQDAPYPF